MLKSKITRSFLAAGLIGGMLTLQACEGVGLTMLGVGSGTAANTSVSHTLGGMAYKTFTAPAKEVRTALRGALKTMDIPVNKESSRSEGGWVLMGKAKEREIEMTIESLTSNVTRLRVIASENALIKDSATATEIIEQTAMVLDDNMSRKRVANSAGKAVAQ
jgi:hypothetical protein